MSETAPPLTIVERQWQWCAAIRTASGHLELVGAVESDDETRRQMYPARERALEHLRAWRRHSAGLEVVLVSRPIAAWEVVDV